MTIHINGPVWAAWTTWALCVLFTILFLLGKGSFLIAGFHSMSEKEQMQYDKKKLCHTMGKGFLVIDMLILVLLLGENILPEWTMYVFLGVTILDIVYIIYATNFKCRKQ